MAIATMDALVNALGNAAQRIQIQKATITTVAAFYYSTWKATGIPVAAANPTTWATDTNSTTGAMPLTNATGGNTLYLAQVGLVNSVANSLIIADRLGEMGGLNGTLTTAQTVSGTLTTPAASGRCASNGSDVQWFLEWYTATGATGATATISYTNQSGTSGQTTTVTLPVSVPASRMYPILPGGTDTSIQSIETVTLSISTGTAGNFGVTAIKFYVQVPQPLAALGTVYDFASLGFPPLPTNCCLFIMMLAAGAAAGVITGNLTLCQG